MLELDPKGWDFSHPSTFLTEHFIYFLTILFQIVPCLPIIMVPCWLWFKDCRAGVSMTSKGLIFDGWKKGDSPVWDPVNEILLPPPNESAAKANDPEK